MWPKVQQTDSGGEYVSKEFNAYLKAKGIRHELTIPHTPEQNGVAERMNQTLLESEPCCVMWDCPITTGLKL